jgi:energy-coupling factor transporter ATP-binding protein EcfA2
VQRLGRELSYTSTGAIALAGRRGVGKTTLLRALAAGLLPQVDLEGRLTVVVPAPARYQLREFVLHLHATVCRAVLEAMGNPRIAQGAAVLDRWEHHRRSADPRAVWRRAARCLIRTTAYLSIAVGSAALLWQRSHDLGAVLGVYVAQVRQLIESTHALSQDTVDTWARALLAVVWVTWPLLAALRWLLKLAALPLRHLLVRAGRWCRERARSWGVRWQVSSFRFGARAVLTKAAPMLPRAWRLRVSEEPPRDERVRATLTGIERGRRLRQLDQPMQALAALATEQLRRIRFLQTHTSGWSGKVEGPRSLGMTVTRSIAHAEQPLTQPEVVDQLRGFLQHAATTLIRAGEITGLAIAIDELDKFADPVQAHEFINEIKTIFDVHNCVFLVSVSDDALASFELRGIPVRDALDSAFTAMITVDPFTLAEAYDWLDHRLVGLPSPYAGLCYVLSAGIPRELERAAATLLDLELNHKSGDASVSCNPDSPYLQLAEVTRTIVSADVAAKLRAFTFTVHQQPPSELTSQLIVTLSTVGDLTHPRDHDLLNRLDTLAAALCDHAKAMADAELIRISREAAGFCHLCAAILEIFNHELDKITLDALSDEALSTLGEARRALAVEPLLTWSLVSSVRELRAQLRIGTT